MLPTHHTMNLFRQKALWEAMSPDVQELIYRDGNIELRFYYSYVKKFGLTFLRNPAFVAYAMPAWKNKPQHAHEQNRIWQLALAQLPQADVVEWHWHWSCGEINPKGIQASMHHTRILFLEHSHLWDGFKPALQRQIKKGKRSLRIQASANASVLFNMHAESLRRQNEKPLYTLEQCEAVVNFCQQHQQGTVLAAYHNQEIVAAILVAWDHETTYYLCGGSSSVGQAHGAMSYLLWEAIQAAQLRGAKQFDFEGSRHEGIDRFFAGFGAKKIPYTVFEKKGPWLYQKIRSLKQWLNA